MAKSAAERQAEYRVRSARKEDRINTVASPWTTHSINKAAERYGVTKRQAMERMIDIAAAFQHLAEAAVEDGDMRLDNTLNKIVNNIVGAINPAGGWCDQRARITDAIRAAMKPQRSSNR